MQKLNVDDLEKMEIKPETPYPSRRPVADLTPEEAEERRKKTRKSVRKSRRLKKIDTALSEAMDAPAGSHSNLWTEPDEEELSRYTNEVRKKIAGELPEFFEGTHPLAPDICFLKEPEADFVYYVASINRGLDGFGVYAGEWGMRLGGLYGDKAAVSVVEFIIHENPRLLDSPTFSALYRRMLSGVLKFYEGLPNVDPKDLEIIRAELERKNA